MDQPSQATTPELVALIAAEFETFDCQLTPPFVVPAVRPVSRTCRLSTLQITPR